jgi:copper transport protein
MNVFGRRSGPHRTFDSRARTARAWRLTRRAAVVIGATIVLVVLWVAPASAHAELVSASPAPGASVTQAPAVVVRFSEALNPSLSTITVTGTAGDATSGPTAVLPGNGRVMRRPLALLRPGRYVVRWTSVSSDDGHTLSGSYGFAIAAATGAAQQVHGGAVTAEGPLGLTGQLFVFAGLVLWVGAWVLRRPAQRSGVSPSRLDALSRLAPTISLLGSVMVLMASLVAPSTAGLVAGRAGELRLVLLGAATVGVLAARGRWTLYGAAAVVGVIAEAVSGHVAVQSPVLGTALVSVHLAAAGIWLFAITASLCSTRVIRTLLTLSPYAIGAALAVGLTGLGSAALEVSSPTQLVATGYGRILMAKLAVFLLLVGAGAWQWRRRAVGASSAQVRRPVRLEALFAAGALVVATVLSATAPPVPSLTPDTVTAVGSPLAGFVRSGPVSVAQASGPYVVALTIMPPQARPVRARVQVLGATPADRVTDAHLVGFMGGRQRFNAAFTSTDGGIFDGRAPVGRDGVWTFEVTFTSTRGPTDVSFVLSLPAPSGIPELARALRAEDGLRSAQLHETLQSATDRPAITANYSFHAPASISFATIGDQEIDIGTRSFQRSQSSDPWMEQASSAAFRWPDPYFRHVWEPAAVPRIVGTGVVDGVPSRIIAFVRPDLPAWFRIWVGISDGLVRREEMRAESHLMDHTYMNLNRGPSIHPPA